MADASNPFPVLPQNQADYYALQRKMAIAQALQQQATTPLSSDEQGWNQMRIVPRTSALSGVAKLGQALLSGYAANQATDAQRQFGQEQWQGIQGMFGGGQTQQPQGGNLQQGNNTGVTPAGPAGSQPSPMNPAGLPPTAAAMMYMRDPAGYQKDMVAPYYSPTDATKLAMQAGQDPRMANAGALAKANNIAPVEGRAGGYTYMPQVNQDGIVSYVPKYNQQITAGAMPIYDASGHQIPGEAPLPGATGITQGMAAAQGMGAASAKPIQAYDANGNPVWTNEASAASGGSSGGPGGGSMFPGYTPPNGGSATRPGLPVGTPDLVKPFIDRFQQGQEAAKNAPQDIQAFRGIQQAASKINTGSAADRQAYWSSMAHAIPGLNANPQNDNDIKTNVDIISKYADQIAGRNGGRSDAALENALHSITNAGMSNAAINDLTPGLIGGRMSDLGRSNAAQTWLQQHGNAPASLGEFEQKWNQVYDPDVYRFQAMNPQQQQQFVGSLSKDRAADLLQRRQALRKMGALPDAGQ